MYIIRLGNDLFYDNQRFALLLLHPIIILLNKKDNLR